MVDHSCDDKTEREIRDCVMGNKDVLGIDLLQTRIFGNKIYVDVEIRANASYTLKEAHEIAESVHNDIEKNFWLWDVVCNNADDTELDVYRRQTISA